MASGINFSNLSRVLSFAALSDRGRVAGISGGGPPKISIPFSSPFILNPVSFVNYLKYLKDSGEIYDARKYVFDVLRKEIALSESIVRREEEIRHISIARAVWPERYYLDRILTPPDPNITGGTIDIGIEGNNIEIVVSGGSGEFDDKIKRLPEDLKNNTRCATQRLLELIHASGLFSASDIEENSIYFSFTVSLG